MRIGAGLLALGLLAGCHSAYNYSDTAGPRFVGTAPAPATAETDPPAARSVRVVTFNVQYAIHTGYALQLLTSAPGLRDADIVLLEEMDAPGAERIARGLGMSWVYYPATIQPNTGRDFGNAVLSRWPISGDRKIVLPHVGRFVHTERIAVAATVTVHGVPVRVYATHLGTPGDVGPGSRADQLRAILDDAESSPVVIVGGDFNSGSVAGRALERGFLWPTREGPRTTMLGRIDHILLRGLTLYDSSSTGTGPASEASDHRPVWLVARLPGAASPPAR